MPRTGKVGKREGASGQAYSNRTDLNQPAQADPEGRPYGERQAQVRAQQEIPLPDRQASAQAAGGQAPVNAPVPGELGDLFGPSQRADEPLTAGVDFGPGPGSDSLISNQDRWVAPVRRVAQQTGDPYLQALLEGQRG